MTGKRHCIRSGQLHGRENCLAKHYRQAPRADNPLGTPVQSTVLLTEDSIWQVPCSSSGLCPSSKHSPSASAAAVAAAASGTAAAAGQAVSGWVEFLRGLLVDPNGSSHSSWGLAVWTGEGICKRKGQAHGVKDSQAASLSNRNPTAAIKTDSSHSCLQPVLLLCRKVRDTRDLQGLHPTCFSRSPK